jgi:K+-transporting ATPase KdpF subunit
MLAAAVDNWIGLVIGVGILAFLVVVLLFPERF